MAGRSLINTNNERKAERGGFNEKQKCTAGRGDDESALRAADKKGSVQLSSFNTIISLGSAVNSRERGRSEKGLAPCSR